MQAPVGTKAFRCTASTQQQSPRRGGSDRPTMHCCASLQLHCVASFFIIAVGGHFRNGPARQTGRVSVCDGSNERSEGCRSQCNALSQRQVKMHSSSSRRDACRTKHRLPEALHHFSASPQPSVSVPPPGRPGAALLQAKCFPSVASRSDRCVARAGTRHTSAGAITPISSSQGRCCRTRLRLAPPSPQLSCR